MGKISFGRGCLCFCWPQWSLIFLCSRSASFSMKISIEIFWNDQLLREATTSEGKEFPRSLLSHWLSHIIPIISPNKSRHHKLCKNTRKNSIERGRKFSFCISQTLPFAFLKGFRKIGEFLCDWAKVCCYIYRSNRDIPKESYNSISWHLSESCFSRKISRHILQHF